MTELKFADDLNQEIEEEDPLPEEDQGRTAEAREKIERAKRRRYRHSLITKAKIIVAAWQIASSTPTVLLQVRFPPLFAQVAALFDVFGVEAFDIESVVRCAFGWSYFHRLAFVTLTPFVVLLLSTILYVAIEFRRGKLKEQTGRRKAFSNFTYFTLVLIYVVLPGVSTYVITFLNCEKFDRGPQRRLNVLAVEPSVSCTSKRYRRWLVYDVLMVAIWPAGATFVIAVLLWNLGDKLNPAVDPVTPESIVMQEEIGHDDKDGFERDRQRCAIATEQRRKLKKRNADKSLDGFRFLFEE